MSEYKRLTSGNFDGQCEYYDYYIDGCRIGNFILKCKECPHKERYDRLKELEDKLESSLLLELPCRVGDTVYGVDFTECQSKYATTEKEKRKIFNVCTNMNGSCDKCKYSIPAVHKFVCTQIQIAEDKYTYVVGAKCENYRFENVFLTQEAAEARVKELQEKNNG